jgi:hypothetical protein
MAARSGRPCTSAARARRTIVPGFRRQASLSAARTHGVGLAPFEQAQDGDRGLRLLQDAGEVAARIGQGDAGDVRPE